MARGNFIRRDAHRLRRLLQDIGKDEGDLVQPVKEALATAADHLEQQIRWNIVGVGAVNTGDLLDSVVNQRRSGGLVFRVGFAKQGAIRAWRKAGWRAHFIEFGTKYPNQPAYRPVTRAARQILPQALDDIDRALSAALQDVARNYGRSRSRRG